MICPVLDSVHNIHPGVPVEKILAVFELGRLAGRDPLQLGHGASKNDCGR